jgi:hypothetical protein
MKLNHQQMLEQLRSLYNGYRFGLDLSSGDVSTGVYNPFSINYVFAKNAIVQKWFESGSPSFLIEKIKEGNFTTIAQEGIEMNFNELSASCTPDAISAQTLLYYAGYATMVAYEPRIKFVKLAYPNQEVAQAMSTHLLPLFTRPNVQTAQSKLIKQLALSFLDGQLDRIKDLLNQSLAQISYSIMLPYETYFQSLVFLMLQAGNLDVYPEVETNSNRLDIVIKTAGSVYILELKFNKPAAQGLQQIKDRLYIERYRALDKPIIGVGISIALKDNSNADEVLQNRSLYDVVWERLN